MAVFPLSAGIEIISEETVASPASARLRRDGPTNQELDAISLTDYWTPAQKDSYAIETPKESHAPSEGWKSHDATGDQTPVTPNELESHWVPSAQTPTQSIGIAPSLTYPYMNRWRVLAACLVFIGNGMNDSAPGALIPYIESYYSIGYAVVSLIFITNATGFISAAFFSDWICSRIGQAKSLMIAEALMMAGYIVIACSPPFAAVVASYLVLGFGNAMNLAYTNVFCANLAQPTIILGFAHGSYGIGGILAPIIATTMVKSGLLWSRSYLIGIGLRFITLCSTGWSFWNYEKEQTSQLTHNLNLVASQQQAEEVGEPAKVQLLARALRNRTVIIGALFIFAYQGGEVADSGWLITYLINYRGGDPDKVGYVTAGFWGGITAGRFALSYATQRIGESRSVFILGVTAVVFQLIAWQVPNIIGDAVAVAILGLVLGPIYPCATTIFSRLLPRSLQVIGISFITSAGSSGGAIVPFMTGLIAQAAGTFVLHPICMGAFVLMIASWAFLPKVSKHDE